MDKRGQRKAIKNAYSGVIRDANRWMLYKELHHLYPCVAATIFAMPNKTGAAARSTSQSHTAKNRSCDGVNKWCRCYKEHSNAYTQSKPGREHRFKINSFACHSECKVQLKNA